MQIIMFKYIFHTCKGVEESFATEPHFFIILCVCNIFFQWNTVVYTRNVLTHFLQFPPFHKWRHVVILSFSFVNSTYLICSSFSLARGKTVFIWKKIRSFFKQSDEHLPYDDDSFSGMENFPTYSRYLVGSDCTQRHLLSCIKSSEVIEKKTSAFK